ncbi:hypothetical protein [Vibrio sp. AND4]|uniref:hypothetical protein n=1 Tax=Vibrio sp. AND4 TaxID=314289 RepID=UPI00015EFC57|nr:hypothetical protein [Vibrio sp. AND4]EDP60125.1 hypothetical protein AND4_01913 [Vibrio sp. AND4]
MKFKALVLASSIGLSLFSAASFAGDPDIATATVLWKGVVGGIINGQQIKITGANGGAIDNGTLTVNSDGTFTSSAVDLEAHEVTPGSNLTLTNTDWTLVKSSVYVDGQAANEAKLVVKDLLQTQELTVDKAITGSSLRLTVENDAAITAVTLDNQVEVAVTVQASLTV